MINQQFKFLVLCTFILMISSCKQKTKQEVSNSSPIQVDVKAEIEKWKQELIESKQIGSPCNYKGIDSLAYQKWGAKNPDQMDGFPFDNKEITAIQKDFNNNHKEDLLLYFMGINCTGHNGGTETYAKIIYSDGTNKSDLMLEIINAIQSEYNIKRETNKNLKEITDNYLETTTVIKGYTNGIIGSFKLYAKDDPHCCPSYNGTYTYKLTEKDMNIAVLENN